MSVTKPLHANPPKALMLTITDSVQQALEKVSPFGDTHLTHFVERHPVYGFRRLAVCGRTVTRQLQKIGAIWTNTEVIPIIGRPTCPPCRRQHDRALIAEAMGCS